MNIKTYGTKRKKTKLKYLKASIKRILNLWISQGVSLWGNHLIKALQQIKIIQLSMVYYKLI